MICHICKKETDKLVSLEFHDGETKLSCPDCFDYYESQAQMEYQRQKEEGENYE